MGLTPLSTAVQAVLDSVVPAPPESCPIDAANGRHLAIAVVAPRDVPGCDNSAMDGYAVRAEETRGATRDRPACFRVSQTISAGHPPLAPLEAGEAARIFTGAPVPVGADVVIRQEATRIVGDRVEVGVEATVGQNIRRRGEEINRGARVLEPGQKLDAASLGVLASLGIAEVPVYRRPRVALVTVGDELLPPGTNAAPHQIFDSNGPMLRSLIEATGAVVVHRSRASDEPAALQQALQQALSCSEVLVTAGGASVGDRDRVKETLRAQGATFLVDGVALKPGKPAGIATVGDGGRFAAVLPGNPGAATVAFDRLVRPLLLALQGAYEVRRRTRVLLDADRQKQPGLTYVLSATLPRSPDPTRVHVRPQGAGQLLQNVGMDGWVILPPGRARHVQGEEVWFEHLHGSRFLSFEERETVTEDAKTSPVAISFVGHSGAGKTTLLEGLVRHLSQRGLQVAVLKHSSDPHPLHKDGSDTERFERAGAQGIAFVTPTGAQFVLPLSGAESLTHLQALSGASLLLVEGWKHGPLPKIEVKPPSAPALEGIDDVRLTISPDADIEWLAEEVLRIARPG